MPVGVVDYFGNNSNFNYNNTSFNNIKREKMDTTDSCDSSRRVKVFDSRRKQRWVDPILTPPRSPASPTPEEIPDPVLDDILELWDGAGIEELEDILTDEFKNEMNVASALSEFGMEFENDLLNDTPLKFTLGAQHELPPGDSIDEEQILDHLLSYVSDSSPPPTNPPSPPENCGSSSSSSYDEGYIGEDLINEQPDIFDTPINTTEGRISLATNIFEEELGIKNDCMWSDQSTFIEHPQKDELLKDFVDKTHIKIEADIDDANEIELDWTDTFNNWTYDPSANCSNSSSSSSSGCSNASNSPTSSEPESPEFKWSEEAEIIRFATFNDHSYANPNPSDSKHSIIVKSEKNISNFCSNNKKNKSNHTIQGIVIKEEQDLDHQGGPKKTKILVPLKDLMESLQQKTFLVAPLGPGKKVIRLTGSETVKSMLGAVHSNHLSQQSHNHHHHNNCSSNNNNNRRNITNNSFNPNKLRMKKAKQKLLRDNCYISRQDFDSFISSNSSCSSPLSPNSAANSPTKPKKTKTHNNMERLRRIDLRNSFDNLKKLVPILAKSAKCSKVEILRRAEEYVRGIRNLEKRLVKEETTLRNRNEALKIKLAQAQSQHQHSSSSA